MKLTKSTIPGSVGFEPPMDIRAALMVLVLSLGEDGALRALDVNRMTLARVLAGLGVQRGTLLALEQALAAAPVKDERQLALVEV